jgi:hypothetical protein
MTIRTTLAFALLLAASLVSSGHDPVMAGPGAPDAGPLRVVEPAVASPYLPDPAPAPRPFAPSGRLDLPKVLAA